MSGYFVEKNSIINEEIVETCFNQRCPTPILHKKNNKMTTANRHSGLWNDKPNKKRHKTLISVE